MVSSAKLQELTLIRFLNATNQLVGLKIAEMMDVWNQLGIIAMQFEDAFDRRHPNYPLDDPQENARLADTLEESYIDKSNVLDVLSKTLSLSRDAIDRCLQFFTFEPGKGKTLWDRPLLQVREGFSLIWWSLTGINHARVMSQWAKIDKELMAKFEEKGEFNEQMLHELAESSFRSGPYIHDAKVIGANLKPKKKSDEEVDLAFVVGRTLFIIETASVPHPAEPFEFRELDNRLEKKAQQCRNRIAYLTKDKEQVSEWLNEHGITADIERIQGLVVTNSYLRDGTFPSDIIYIHWDTLHSLLKDGGQSFGLMRSDGTKYDLHAQCYDPHHLSHDTTLIEALRYAPKSEFYLRATELAQLKTHRFDETDVSGLYNAWRVVIPAPDKLEEFLRSCTFAERLVESH